MRGHFAACRQARDIVSGDMSSAAGRVTVGEPEQVAEDTVRRSCLEAMENI
jgi:hypothetical protein